MSLLPLLSVNWLQIWDERLYTGLLIFHSHLAKTYIQQASGRNLDLICPEQRTVPPQTWASLTLPSPVPAEGISTAHLAKTLTFSLTSSVPTLRQTLHLYLKTCPKTSPIPSSRAASPQGPPPLTWSSWMEEQWKNPHQTSPCSCPPTPPAHAQTSRQPWPPHLTVPGPAFLRVSCYTCCSRSVQMPLGRPLQPFPEAQGVVEGNGVSKMVSKKRRVSKALRFGTPAGL